jgi:thioredoxin reductase (NADPH)
MTSAGGLRDVAIIGSGPAGYTAAIYAARAGLAPLVFEGSADAGGALMRTSDVENFPGFAEAIEGPDLIARLRAQAERFDAMLVRDDVTRVDLSGAVKVLEQGGKTHLARAVILATGSRYRQLGLANEQRLAGLGVSYCATCDGYFFRGQDLVVVGGGDSALEEATFLTRFATSVTIVHRRGELRASQILQNRANAEPKISFAWHTEVVDILGEQEVTGVLLRDTRDGSIRTVNAQGVFVAIGHEPRSEIVRGQVDVGPNGHILVSAPSTRTNLDGVFACGDVVDATYMQAVTAAGTGCAAALDAQRWLQDTEAPVAIPMARISTTCRV